MEAPTPSPLEIVSREVTNLTPDTPAPRERAFSPSGTVRLCRAILYFKTVLDSDGSARDAGHVPLSTALELYFSTHFPAAVCYQRMLGFYASVVSYQGIAVCRAVARFLHLLPGQDLSAESLRVWLALSVELAAREGSGGARCADLCVLHPEEFSGYTPAATSGARRRSWIGGGGGVGPLHAAPGVAGAVVRDRLRAQGSSAPLVSADAFAEAVSEQLSGGRLPPRALGSLLLDLLGGGGEGAGDATPAGAAALRIVWREGNGRGGSFLPPPGSCASLGERDFVAVEEGLLAVVDAWAAAEDRAHAALRAMLGLGGAGALAPVHSSGGHATTTALVGAAPATPAAPPGEPPSLTPAQVRLPCMAGSVLATLQSTDGVVALQAIGGRDACNVTAALAIHEAFSAPSAAASHDPAAALSPLLRMFITGGRRDGGISDGGGDAERASMRPRLAAAALLLQRVWRLGSVLVSYDTRRCGLLPPWTVAVILAASGLYDGCSAAAMHDGLSRAFRSFAVDPGPQAVSSVFSETLSADARGRVDVARYLHEPPPEAQDTPSAASFLARGGAGSPMGGQRSPSPTNINTVGHLLLQGGRPDGAEPAFPPQLAERPRPGRESPGGTLPHHPGGAAAAGAAIPWAAQVLRAAPLPSSSRAHGGGGAGTSLISDDSAAFDYARFWAVLYGLVVEVCRAAGPAR